MLQLKLLNLIPIIKSESCTDHHCLKTPQILETLKYTVKILKFEHMNYSYTDATTARFSFPGGKQTFVYFKFTFIHSRGIGKIVNKQRIVYNQDT